MEISSQDANNVKKLKTSDSVNLSSLEFKPPSIISSLISPVGIGYRSKLSRLVKNRLNKSQVTLDTRSSSKLPVAKQSKEEVAIHLLYC